jgi:hypothetical protein
MPQLHWTEAIRISIIKALAEPNRIGSLPGESKNESFSIGKKTLRQVQNCEAQGQSICNLRESKT